MKKPNQLGFPLLLTGLFWAVVIYWIAVASMPYSPVSVPRIISLNIQTFWPQGWAFFTRNPREERTYFYRMEGDEAVIQHFHNSRAVNLFGARRNARLESMELATIAESIPESSWLNCAEGIRHQDSLAYLPSVKIRNSFRYPKLCGEILIEKKEPVPWAWSKDTSEDEVPSKIAKINVICTP